MENYFIGKEASKLRLLGIYQIAGGIVGIGLFAYLLSGIAVFNEWLVLLLVVSVSMYLYSVFCGVLILKKRPNALAYSRILQFMQVITFSFLGYTYMYSSGIFLHLGVGLTDSFLFKLNAGLSSWQININSGGEKVFAAVNVVPIVLIIYINGILKKSGREKMEMVFEATGSDPLKSTDN